jgi:hypothetical protein
MTHLSRDKTAPKMGHPIVVVRSDVGHPPYCSSLESPGYTDCEKAVHGQPYKSAGSFTSEVSTRNY